MRANEFLTESLNFEEGDCPILAVALNKLTGYPIYALVEWEPKIRKHVLIHAFVKGTEWYYDIDGGGDVDYYLEKYPNNGGAELVKMTAQEVLKIGYGKHPIPNLASVLPYAQEIVDDNELAKSSVAEAETYQPPSLEVGRRR